MITDDLTDNQLNFLLYAICDESFEKMVSLGYKIDQICMTCETMRVEELFSYLDLNCPEELKPYGWRKPRRYLDEGEGYFYVYQGNRVDPELDKFWHIKLPIPEKLEV